MVKKIVLGTILLSIMSLGTIFILNNYSHQGTPVTVPNSNTNPQQNKPQPAEQTTAESAMDKIEKAIKEALDRNKQNP